jgi:chromate transporter
MCFLNICMFCFGGGYAMLSLIQNEIVANHHWLNTREFADIVAISQTTPGPIGINAATYVGYAATGSVWGSAVATLAVILPSFILMLAISKFLLAHRHHPTLTAIFGGLRPAIIGLLAAAALALMNEENFGSPAKDTQTFATSTLLFIATFIGTYRFKLHPVALIVAAGIAGLIAY